MARKVKRTDCPRRAPEGCSALYAEVSHRPDEFIGEAVLVDRTVSGLTACGVLRGGDEIRVTDVRDIKYAYVVFDSHSETAVPAIMEYLGGLGISSIGRYGAWEYSSMEDAILEGRRAAESLS